MDEPFDVTDRTGAQTITFGPAHNLDGGANRASVTTSWKTGQLNWLEYSVANSRTICSSRRTTRHAQGEPTAKSTSNGLATPPGRFGKVRLKLLAKRGQPVKSYEPAKQEAAVESRPGGTSTSVTYGIGWGYASSCSAFIMSQDRIALIDLMTDPKDPVPLARLVRPGATA